MTMRAKDTETDRARFRQRLGRRGLDDALVSEDLFTRSSGSSASPCTTLLAAIPALPRSPKQPSRLELTHHV